ncbi:MAG: YgaP family membrane protein [Myxococcaceae bacterium]
MMTERIIRIAAGVFVLLSLALGAPGSPIFHSAHWLWMTAFVGANLLQSGFTRVCPLDLVLRKLGVAASESPASVGHRQGGDA